MKEKSFNLISAIVISLLISSNIYAEDIKIKKNISEKSYRIQELKNNALKQDYKKDRVTALKIENTQMSSTSSMLLGAGIGLVAGALIGGIVGAANDPGGSSGLAGAGFGYGVMGGGVLGLVIGGVTGYILGE